MVSHITRSGYNIIIIVIYIGVLKTYRLTYELAEVVRAVFDVESAHNRWIISSRVLREFIEHFGLKTEQLDVYSENGKAIFLTYTEKITDGKGKESDETRAAFR